MAAGATSAPSTRSLKSSKTDERIPSMGTFPSEQASCKRSLPGRNPTSVTAVRKPKLEKKTRAEQSSRAPTEWNGSVGKSTARYPRVKSVVFVFPWACAPSRSRLSKRLLLAGRLHVAAVRRQPLAVDGELRVHAPGGTISSASAGALAASGNFDMFGVQTLHRNVANHRHVGLVRRAFDVHLYLAGRRTDDFPRAVGLVLVTERQSLVYFFQIARGHEMSRS